MDLNTGVEEAVVKTSRVDESFVSERHGHLSADRSGGGLWSGTPMEQRNCWELGEECHLWRERGGRGRMSSLERERREGKRLTVCSTLLLNL